MKWKKDPHLEWLRVGVPGWSHQGNIDATATAIAEMPNGAVVEIGSFVGLSTCIISRLLELESRAALFYSVDDWIFQGYVPGGRISQHITYDNWRIFTEQQFRANVEYFTNCRPYHIKSRSDDFFQAWSEEQTRIDLFGRSVKLGGEIAFAFIDGDHSYEGSKRDMLNAIRFLAPGGYLLIDDSYTGAPHECRRVAEEMLEHPDLSFVGRFPNIMLQRKPLTGAQALSLASNPSAA